MYSLVASITVVSMFRKGYDNGKDYLLGGSGMANRVAPKVRLLFACDDAEQLSDGRWVLTNPWAVLDFPPGVARLDEPKLWFYMQLAEGVGEFELSLQMRYFEADGTWRTIGRGKNPTRMDFKGAEQLRVFERALSLANVPFEKPGIYEFRLVAVNYPEQGQMTVVEGQTAVIRVLDRRDQI